MVYKYNKLYDTGYNFSVVLIDVCGKCLNFITKKNKQSKNKSIKA